MDTIETVSVSEMSGSFALLWQPTGGFSHFLKTDFFEPNTSLELIWYVQLQTDRICITDCVCKIIVKLYFVL